MTVVLGGAEGRSVRVGYPVPALARYPVGDHSQPRDQHRGLDRHPLRRIIDSEQVPEQAGIAAAQAMPHGPAQSGPHPVGGGCSVHVELQKPAVMPAQTLRSTYGGTVVTTELESKLAQQTQPRMHRRTRVRHLHHTARIRQQVLPQPHPRHRFERLEVRNQLPDIMHRSQKRHHRTRPLLRHAESSADDLALASSQEPVPQHPSHRTHINQVE